MRLVTMIERSYDARGGRILFELDYDNFYLVNFFTNRPINLKSCREKTLLRSSRCYTERSSVECVDDWLYSAIVIEMICMPQPHCSQRHLQQ